MGQQARKAGRYRADCVRHPARWRRPFHLDQKLPIASGGIRVGYSAPTPSILSWISMKRLLLFVVALLPYSANAAPPQDAERFTHLAGVNLSDLPRLEDLQRIFGRSPIVESGDAGEYDARVCYRSVDGASVVEFFHGEVDWGFVVHITKPHDSRCSTSAVLKPSVLSVAGVKLGMKKAAYTRLLGKPRRETANLLEHYFSYVRTLTDSKLAKIVERNRKDGYPITNPEELRRSDVGIDISASFVEGRLASFTVGRAETN
jgi:hypothetical protein